MCFDGRNWDEGSLNNIPLCTFMKHSSLGNLHAMCTAGASARVYRWCTTSLSACSNTVVLNLKHARIAPLQIRATSAVVCCYEFPIELHTIEPPSARYIRRDVVSHIMV